MNGGNLFTVLISTIKSRFSAITSKLKLWTSWNFIRSRIITKIRQFFAKLFDVKPKDKDDYYTVFRWMISKKLAYSAVIILGVVSIWYIVSVKSTFANLGDSGPIRTYKYNSMQLRMAKDKVKILGKSGYLAYEGDVDKGYVTGNGTLYGLEGNLVYQGQFEKNKYEGVGKYYYENGNLCYEGDFHDNLFEGVGRQYRESGSLLYYGEFTRGKKNGEGKLCAENAKVIFDGLFANDELVYSSFINKTTAEAADMYNGVRRVWRADDTYCVFMSDIGAVYSGDPDPESVSDDVTVKNVYVLKDYLPVGERTVSEIKDIKKAYGKPIYEGTSRVLLSEAVVINILNETRTVLSGYVEMDDEEPYSDVTFINSFDRDYEVYLTAFRIGDLVYTFYSEDKNGTFLFYSINGIVEA